MNQQRRDDPIDEINAAMEEMRDVLAQNVGGSVRLFNKTFIFGPEEVLMAGAGAILVLCGGLLVLGGRKSLQYGRILANPVFTPSSLGRGIREGVVRGGDVVLVGGIARVSVPDGISRSEAGIRTISGTEAVVVRQQRQLAFTGSWVHQIVSMFLLRPTMPILTQPLTEELVIAPFSLEDKNGNHSVAIPPSAWLAKKAKLLHADHGLDPSTVSVQGSDGTVITSPTILPPVPGQTIGPDLQGTSISQSPTSSTPSRRKVLSWNARQRDDIALASTVPDLLGKQKGGGMEKERWSDVLLSWGRWLTWVSTLHAGKLRLRGWLAPPKGGEGGLGFLGERREPLSQLSILAALEGMLTGIFPLGLRTVQWGIREGQSIIIALTLPAHLPPSTLKSTALLEASTIPFLGGLPVFGDEGAVVRAAKIALRRGSFATFLGGVIALTGAALGAAALFSASQRGVGLDRLRAARHALEHPDAASAEQRAAAELVAHAYDEAMLGEDRERQEGDDEGHDEGVGGDGEEGGGEEVGGEGGEVAEREGREEAGEYVGAGRAGPRFEEVLGAIARGGGAVPPPREAQDDLGPLPSGVVIDPLDVASSGMDDERNCITCVTRIRKVVMWPCGHLCVCRTCARRLAIPECPMCRARVRRFIAVFE